MFKVLYLGNEWAKLETVKELINYFCVFSTEIEKLWKAYRHFHKKCLTWFLHKIEDLTFMFDTAWLKNIFLTKIVKSEKLCKVPGDLLN